MMMKLNLTSVTGSKKYKCADNLVKDKTERKHKGVSGLCDLFLEAGYVCFLGDLDTTLMRDNVNDEEEEDLHDRTNSFEI